MIGYVFYFYKISNIRTFLFGNVIISIPDFSAVMLTDEL